MSFGVLVTPSSDQLSQAVKDAGGMSDEAAAHAKATQAKYRAKKRDYLAFKQRLRRHEAYITKHGVKAHHERLVRERSRQDAVDAAVAAEARRLSAACEAHCVSDLITPPEATPISTYVDRLAPNGRDMVREMVPVNPLSPLKRARLGKLADPPLPSLPRVQNPKCFEPSVQGSGEALALRLVGEIRVGWSFAKSEKHTTHTQHTHNTHNVRRCVRSRNKEKLFCYSVQKRLSSLSSISQYLLAKRSKDFSSRKVKVLVSKSYITRAETVNRNRFITPSRGFSRVPDTIRLLKNLPAKVNHSNKRDSDPLASLELLQALYTVQRY
ncbi:hypothetical protein C8R45DRAFT_929626 [Mycena sanguinolenta]|nr:hypothetical protein C8R45DRAFT_929626 [Mycena sanguinolenta]